MAAPSKGGSNGHAAGQNKAADGAKRGSAVKFAPDTKPATYRRVVVKQNSRPTRYGRQKIGKAQLKRDVPIFIAIMLFLAFFAFMTKDTGTKQEGEKTVTLADLRKSMTKLVTEFEREQANRKRKTECELFLAESTIPSLALSWYAGRDFKPGEVVLERGLALPEDLHGPGLFENDLLLKHHPSLINIEPGETATAPFVASRAIEAGEELFLSYENHPHSRLGVRHPVYRDIPTPDEYVMAEAIFWIESEAHYSKIKTSAQQTMQPRRAARDIGGDSALKMVYKAVHLLNHRIANLLPDNVRRITSLFQDGRSFPNSVVHNRTVYWLEHRGKCMNDVEVRGGEGVFAKRPIKQGQLIMLAPLMVRRKAEACDTDSPQPPKTMGEACFGHSNSPAILCPFSSASSMKFANQTSTNAHYQWGGWNGKNHDGRTADAERLIGDFVVGMTMDIVATTDIEAGGEVILDISDAQVAEYGFEISDYKFPANWRS